MSKNKSSPGSNSQFLSNSAENFECIELARKHNQSSDKPSNSVYNHIDNPDRSLLEMPNYLIEAKTRQSFESSADQIFQDVLPKKETKVKLKDQHEILSIKSHQKSIKSDSIISSSNNKINKSFTHLCYDYKYIVLIASFLSYMLAALLSSCFGVFFESMEADLGWSKGQCAFIGALLSALNELAGPIASSLTNRYGCRATTIFGGLIAALGVIGSAYTHDFWLLSFLLGGVSGFGSSLVLVASVVVVTYYFEDKPSLAAGLTISGASFGQSIFTMIIISLNEHYGRSGCFLILGGILLNTVVCGALFRPLQWELEDESDSESDSSSDDSSSTEATESDYESSNRADNSKSLLLPQHNKPVMLSAPIASIESIQNLSTSLNHLHRTSCVHLSKNFSSDSCLDHNKSNNHDQEDNYPGDDEEEIYNLNQDLDEICSVKSADFLTKSTNHESKYKPKHRSMNILSRDRKAFIDDLVNNNNLEINFSKSAGSLNLYKSFLSFARTVNNKSTDECELDREQLEKAGFFVVDAEELVGCGSQEDGLFFPFITSEENFRDQIKEFNVSEEQESEVGRSGSVDRVQSLNEEMIDEVLVSEQSHDGSFREILLNENQPEPLVQGGIDGAEIKFSHCSHNNNQPYSSNTNSIFSKLSEFFATKRSTRTNNLNTSLGLTQKSASPLSQQSVLPPVLPTNSISTSILPVVKKTKNSSSKNQNIFIKPVRTAQNGQRFIIARCTCQSAEKSSRVSHKHHVPFKSSQTTTTNHQTPIIPVQTAADSYNNPSIYYQRQNTKAKSPKNWRHNPNCPVTYLNRLKNISHPNHALSAPHHHHHYSSHQNSFTYLPSALVPRFPLHFKNVYYYKSLINLNMRLKQLKNDEQQHQQHDNKQGNLNKPKSNLNTLSLSCPDLNLNQVLVLNSADKKLVPLNYVNKPLQTKLLQRKLVPADRSDAGLLLTKNIGENKIKRGPILTKSKKSTLQQKTLENTILNAGKFKQAAKSLSNKSLNTLKDYNDNILEEKEIYKRNLRKSRESISASSSSSSRSSSSSDDESSSDEDSDEECANFFSKTKLGTCFYKHFWRPVVRPFKHILSSIKQSFKLFCLFKFCVFALCNFILSFFYDAPFYFINSYMIENNLNHNQAGTVNVAVGIVCIFSSIGYGYMGDSKRINSIIMYSVSLVMCGLCCCLIPFFIQDYLITMVLMTLIGALISVSDVLVPIICVNLVGYDDFVDAYGLMFFCQGIASLSGPPLLGMIVDWKGFALSYYIIGVGITLSGLILTSILCYNKIEQNKKMKAAVADNVATKSEITSLNV